MVEGRPARGRALRAAAGPPPAARVEGLRFAVSDFRFRVSGTKFRIQGLYFEVGFRIQDFASGNPCKP